MQVVILRKQDTDKLSNDPREADVWVKGIHPDGVDQHMAAEDMQQYDCFVSLEMLLAYTNCDSLGRVIRQCRYAAEVDTIMEKFGKDEQEISDENSGE